MAFRSYMRATFPRLRRSLAAWVKDTKLSESRHYCLHFDLYRLINFKKLPCRNLEVLDIADSLAAAKCFSSQSNPKLSGLASNRR
jgi:hypothetical protein